VITRHLWISGGGSADGGAGRAERTAVALGRALGAVRSGPLFSQAPAPIAKQTTLAARPGGACMG
jgi:hypothetical protein